MTYHAGFATNTPCFEKMLLDQVCSRKCLAGPGLGPGLRPASYPAVGSPGLGPVSREWAWPM